EASRVRQLVRAFRPIRSVSGLALEATLSRVVCAGPRDPSGSARPPPTVKVDGGSRAASWEEPEKLTPEERKAPPGGGGSGRRGCPLAQSARSDTAGSTQEARSAAATALGRGRPPRPAPPQQAPPGPAPAPPKGSPGRTVPGAPPPATPATAPIATGAPLSRNTRRTMSRRRAPIAMR